MGKWDKEIAEAKASLDPKQGTVQVEHKNGFIIMTLVGFLSLPKTQQTKILKSGGN